MSHQLMTPIDVLCVDPVELAHPLGQVRLRRFHHEVAVIGHLTVGMHAPIETLADRAQLF